MTINYEYEPCTYNSNPICAPITCLAPTPSSVSDISQNLATLNWSDDNGSSWEYYYSTENTTPIVDGTQTNNKFANLTNLAANTTYFWWVRTVCLDGKSTWAYGGSFTTLTYTLDAFSSNETLGTISINGYVITGSPDECSKYGSPAYTVTEGTADVSKNGNRFTVTPTSNCTVRINFVEKERYAVKWYVNGEILSSYSKEYCEGATIANADVPDNPAVPSLCGEKVFMGWAEEEFEEIDNPSATIRTKAQIGNIVAVNNDINYYAVFAQNSGGSVVYEKVIAEPADWSGKYLIAYDDETFMNGELSGSTIGEQGQSVDPGTELSGTTVTGTWGDAHCLEIIAVTDGYVLKTLTNDYIYRTGSSNGISSTSNIATATTNKLSIEFESEDDISIYASNGYVLHYNPSGFFRFYKNGGQENIYMYRRSGGGSSYSAYTTFCPCAFDTDGIDGDNNYIWSGKNAGADWGSTSNWVFYNSSETKYHLAANEPANSTNRNISSQYYHRLLASQNKAPVVAEMKEITAPMQADKLEFIKNPVVAEFLGLAPNADFTETKLEQSIITHLQKFLIELGKGYAFVARQQHIATDAGDYFIDLVFYNYILKCFVLIDLKTARITHQDVGQMDMYVRMYDELKRSEGDNPTIGILLCSETSEDIARYSVLHDSKQQIGRASCRERVWLRV